MNFKTSARTEIAPVRYHADTKYEARKAPKTVCKQDFYIANSVSLTRYSALKPASKRTSPCTKSLWATVQGESGQASISSEKMMPSVPQSSKSMERAEGAREQTTSWIRKFLIGGNFETGVIVKIPEVLTNAWMMPWLSRIC